jgi:hypothetical protein
MTIHVPLLFLLNAPQKIVIPVRLAPDLSDNVASVLFMRHGVGVVQLPVVLRRRLRAFVLDLYPQLFSQRW